MTAIDTKTKEPSLEWCPDCDRPTEWCECDRTSDEAEPAIPGQHPTAASLDTERSSDEPETEHRTPPEADTEQRLDTTGATDRTASEHDTSAAADSDRATASGIDSGTEGPLGWRAWLKEWGALVPIFALAGLLGIAGFAVSFFTVEEKMRPHMGDHAWIVPAGIDVGIIVFTLLDIFLARKDKRIPWMRYVGPGLTAATIYLNVTSSTVLEAQVAHAVLPSLWVVFCEAIARIMKLKAKEEAKTTRAVPLLRWVCAPVATFILWRSMQLWAFGSYEEALKREEDRQLAKAVMKDEFGGVRKAPRKLKVRYRQRKITIDEVYRYKADLAVRRGVQSPSNTRQADTGQSKSQASTPARDKTRSKSPRVQSDRSKPASGQRPPRPSNPSVSGMSKTDALAKVWADCQSKGNTDPSVRELAERAGCSTGLAGTFKQKMRASENTNPA